MKNKIAIFTIAAIILVAISLNVVIFIAVPSILLDTPTFKVVWIFAFPVNVLMAIIATYFAFRESVDDIIRIPPIMYLVYTFATIYFTLGMKFMYTPFKSYKIPLATGIIVTTVYIIVFVFLLFGIGFIESNKVREKRKINYIGLMRADVENCLIYVTDENTKAQLLKLADKIRFSDPMSHDSLANCERELEEAIMLISSTLRADGSADVSNHIKRAEALIDFRNQRCILLK